jgi:hypothetical protein
MDFPIATRIPSFENSFWINLPDSVVVVDVKHEQPTQAIISHCFLNVLFSAVYSHFSASSGGLHTPASPILNPLL